MQSTDNKANPHNINWSKHSGEVSSCDECVAGYPTACACGGMIHAEHVGKTSTNPTGLWYNCNKCGSRFLRANRFGRKKSAHHNPRTHKQNESSRGSNRRV